MKKVILVGAGGHAKVVADIIKLNGDAVVGYLDDVQEDFSVIGKTSEIGKIEDCYYFVAIGNCETRKRLMQANANWYTAIHPRAVIASDANIGKGCCIMANAVINSGTKIGRGVIVNTSASIDHDCSIKDFVHIAPGARISGTVSIGECAWIGVGATISNNISIVEKCIIGAGGVVVKNIDQQGTYVGVPVRRIK